MAEERPPEEASSPEEDRVVRALHAVPFRRAAEFRVIYANSVRFATAPWDFSLVFGQTIVDAMEDVHIEDQVTITLSPQTAKAMAEILNRNLADYERQFGEIRYTPIQSQTEETSQSQQPTNPPQISRPRRRIRLEEGDKEA